jgi:ketosteroid isomerase-like protein
MDSMRVLSLILLVAIPIAAAQQQQPQPVPADAQRAIDLGNAAWVPGLESQDLDRACIAFTEQTLFIDSSGNVTHGLPAFEDALRARLAKGTKITGGKVTQLGAQFLNGKVIEWGSSFLDTVDSRGLHHPGGGYYLAVWERLPDGAWKITRNIGLGLAPQ